MVFLSTHAWDYFFAAALLAPAVLLVDVISFGVAPAALGFAGMDGGWDRVALICFVGCGVSRLARFNVTAEMLSEGKDAVAYFEGTPIPASVVLTAVLAFAAWQVRIGEDLTGASGALAPGSCIRWRCCSSRRER